MAHGLGEQCLAEGTRAADYVGQEITTDGLTGTVTRDMATAVQVFIDEVTALRALYEKRGSPVSLSLEERFDLGPLGPPLPMFGTADVTIWAGEHLHVIDYKHGQGVVVEATENSQLMYYALGATVAQGRVPETIAVSIIQPRAHHPAGPVRTYSFDRETLIEFKQMLFAAAARTQEVDAPLAAGDWCRFCKARAVCPAQVEQAQAVAMTTFEADVVYTPPVPETLVDAEVALVLEKGALVMEWIREVEAYALNRLEDGHDVPGYKLVRGRSNRRWTDADRAAKYLARKGIPANERYTRKLVSPNGADKALKARGFDTQHLEKYWEKPEGAVKIAREGDPRPAVLSAAERVFGPAEPLPMLEESEKTK